MLASAIDQLRLSDEAKSAEIAVLKTVASAKEGVLDEARSAADKLRAELAVACVDKQASEASCAKLAGQIRGLDSELDVLCSSHSQLLQSAEDASVRERELVQQLRQMTDSFNTNSTELQARSATISLLEAQLSQAKEARQNTASRHEGESKAMREQIDLLQAQCAEARQKESQMQAQKDKAAELDAQISLLKADSAKAAQLFNERLHKASADSDRKVEEFEAFKKQTAKIEQGLREDLEKYEHDLQEALDALQKARAENELCKKASNAEVALRIEVDRLTRALAKEKRLFDLRLLGMQEQASAKDEFEQKYLTLLTKVNTATPKPAEKKALLSADSPLQRALRDSVSASKEPKKPENVQPPRQPRTSPNGDCKQQ